MFKRKLKPICKNCVLYSPNEGVCKVAILHEGEKINIPVDASDPCFFKDQFVAVKKDGETEMFRPEIEQVRWWIEDPKTGKQTDKNGVVKMQYPKNFFGSEE